MSTPFDTEAVGLILDWPATINRSIGGGVRNAMNQNKSKQTYKEAAFYAARAQVGAERWNAIFPILGPVMCFITLLPPDKRARDIDNGLKWILDAIQYAGMISDDQQIQYLSADRLDPIAPGYVMVQCGPLNRDLKEQWSARAEVIEAHIKLVMEKTRNG